MTGQLQLTTRSQSRRRTRPTGKPFRSNAECIAAWEDYNKGRLAPKTTLPNYRNQIRIFSEWCDDLLMHEATYRDVWAYLEDRLDGPRGCRLLRTMFSDSSTLYCTAKRDMSQCGSACPGFEPVKVTSTAAALNALKSLWTFFQRRRIVKENIAATVKKEWWEDHKHLTERDTKRRIQPDEVNQLLATVKYIYHKAPLALKAQNMARKSEIIRLRATPDLLNLDEGWIDVPYVRHQKRKGYERLWLSPELVNLLRVYLQYRERRIKRDALTNEPLHDYLFITYRGTPWTSDAFDRHVFDKYAQKAGLLTGTENPDTTLTVHDLRHFGTTWMKAHEVDDYYVALFRGDKRGVIADTYTHLTPEKIRDKWMDVRPRILTA